MANLYYYFNNQTSFYYNFDSSKILGGDVVQITMPNNNNNQSIFSILDDNIIHYYTFNSIYIAKKKSNISLEVCVSDNNSNSNTKEIVEKFNDNLLIKFNKNEKNLGLGVNILKSVSMAKGEFVWIIGNDDLLLPKTLFVIENLLNKNKLVTNE